MTSTSWKRPALIAGCSAVVAMAAVAAASPASAAPATVTSPGMLQITRKGEAQNTLHVSWKSVPGAARYTVNIFDGSAHKAYTVPAGTTSFDFTGNGACTRYRAIVTAIAADGTAASTAPYLVAPLGAGGVQGLKVARSESGGDAKVYWQAPPAAAGTQPASYYRVVVKMMAKDVVIDKYDTKDTAIGLQGLDPARAYVASITPMNEWGGCAPSSALVRGAQPGPVTGLKVERDTGSPSRIALSWGAPEWTGFGQVTAYQVGVRSAAMRTPEWKTLDSKDGKFELNLDPKQRWSVWVRALNGDTAGTVSKETVLERLGAPGAPVVDPQVKIIEGDAGKINVTFRGPVGSSAEFPKMDVAIAPTLGGEGLRENQQVFNRAGTYSFDSVPCGMYTVTVTGSGATTTKEFARNVINRCNAGEVSKDLWKLAYGQATIANNQVNMNKGGEARVVSTLPNSSQDMVLTTDAKLEKGWGYGIWTRATLVKGAAVSGYSFQYDPGYQNVNAGFGKALLLRVWQDGRECGTPIAKVQWPAGLKVNETNKVMVVTKGDSLYATIGGVRVFDVPSLKGALESSKCGMAEPTGTQIGFRTWSSDTVATFHNTTINSQKPLTAEELDMQKKQAEIAAAKQAESDAKAKQAQLEAQKKQLEAEAKTQAEVTASTNRTTVG